MLTGNFFSVKSIQLSLLNGTPESFWYFWMKLKAFAGMKGFQKVLKESSDVDFPPSKDAEVVEGSNANNEHNCNVKKMTFLTMAFMMESNMMMIMRAQTDEWPSGLE